MAKKTFTLATESLLRPLSGKKAADKRSWSIPVNEVWRPYFTAMVVAGKMDASQMSDQTLGAPVRQAFEKDGTTPRFNDKGDPMTKVTKQLSDAVGIVRQNFVSALLADAANVQKADPVAFREQTERANKAGKAMLESDASKVRAYLDAVAQAQREAAKLGPDRCPACKRTIALCMCTRVE